MKPIKKNIIGFTLLEILIALFIFTIIAVIMTRALHSVFTTQAATEKHATQLAELQLVMLLTSRDLEQVINRQIINAKGDTEAAFIGSTSTLVFTHGGLANPEGVLQRSTLQRTRYAVASNHFIRETWPVLDQASNTTSSKRAFLNDAIALQFEYIDQDNHPHNSWPPSDLPKATPLPRAVRLTLKLSQWGEISQLYIMPGQTFVLHTTP